jgi:peptidoglycan hydrolase-like amidase
MSGIGATDFAINKGFSAKDILSYYYPGTEIVKKWR